MYPSLHRQGDSVRRSRWQQRRCIEQAVRADERATGEVVNLLDCAPKRFEEIVCNQLPVSSGRYYEYLFSCIAYTVFGEQFEKADVRTDVAEHFDVTIAGVRCDFTRQVSEKSKRPRDDIVLIRFPHKAYHKGARPKRNMAEIVVSTILDSGVGAIVDRPSLNELNRRIAEFAY